jgi:riboflavin biosynthesis pyrimidine reductase
MSTAASLVVGSDGSTIKGGSSRGVSTPADRSIFLQRRALADVIIIGGNTARTEPYAHTPAPLVVISRGLENPLPVNPKAHIWNTTLAQALTRARDAFGPNILIEAGPAIIFELLHDKLIDDLYLSVTPEIEGENPIDWRALLSFFPQIQKSEVEGTLFFHAHH